VQGRHAVIGPGVQTGFTDVPLETVSFKFRIIIWVALSAIQDNNFVHYYYILLLSIFINRLPIYILAGFDLATHELQYLGMYRAKIP
jgi:hypothetical protein